MAYTKLKLYNEALLLVGERSLSGLTEEVESRFKLDEAYDADAIEYCLEQVQPAFARRTVLLDSPTSGTSYTNLHAFPSDYVSFLELHRDIGLDQPIDRYVVNGNSIETDQSEVYLRYISDTDKEDFDQWDVTFGKVVSAYLALEISPRLTKDQRKALQEKFDDRVARAKEVASRSEGLRPSSDNTTISADFLPIYNDALLIMGLEDIISVNDESNRRFKLSQALSAGIVEDEMEDLGWQFSQTSTKLFYNPSIEPEWGYRRVFDKPEDLHRLDGIYTDEMLSNPLRFYIDEDGKWFCNFDEIYIVYVSTDFLETPSAWPRYFKRLIAARMAKDAAPSLVSEGANIKNANEAYEEREDKAKSNDAMASPPKVLREGDWIRNRHRGNRQGRPGER